MGQLHQRIAAALTAEVAARTEWDEPPALSFLYLEAGEPVLRSFPLPGEVWSANRPPAVLARLSSSWERAPGLLTAVAPAGLHGVAFRCEAWMVSDNVPGTAERSEKIADAHAHRLYLRPDRTEVRSMWAVDRSGAVYMAMLRRGLDREPQAEIFYPGPGRVVEGDVPASLERIVSALLGVTLPGQQQSGGM